MQRTPTRWYQYVSTVTEGLTAKEAADRAGFDQSAMSRWKNGLNADVKFVVQFARAFHQNVLKALAEAEIITDEEANLHEVRIGNRVENPPARRARGHRPEHTRLIAQRGDIANALPAISDQHRQVHQAPATDRAPSAAPPDPRTPPTTAPSTWFFKLERAMILMPLLLPGGSGCSGTALGGVGSRRF